MDNSFKLCEIWDKMQQSRDRLMQIYETEGTFSSPLVLEASIVFDRYHNEFMKLQRESGS